MSNPVFPTLPSGSLLDSKQFTVTPEDPGMATEIEGGYVVSRAKYTRRPRDTWSCGYTMLWQADYDVIQAFYKDTVKGSSVIFDWINPNDGLTYQVRFKQGQPLTWSYSGTGPSKRWNCTFTLQQA